MSAAGVMGSDWRDLSAVQLMLGNHEPFPAIAIDRSWNIRLSNRSFEMLAGMIGSSERNLMRLFFHAEGIRPMISNWTAIAPLLWHRAQREADALGGDEMRAILKSLGEFQDAETLWAAEDAVLVPVLPIQLRANGVEVSLFTVIATFGTAQDITADELRIESFFPGDKATEALFRGA